MQRPSVRCRFAGPARSVESLCGCACVEGRGQGSPQASQLLEASGLSRVHWIHAHSLSPSLAADAVLPAGAAGPVRPAALLACLDLVGGGLHCLPGPRLSLLAASSRAAAASAAVAAAVAAAAAAVAAVACSFATSTAAAAAATAACSLATAACFLNVAAAALAAAASSLAAAALPAALPAALAAATSFLAAATLAAVAASSASMPSTSSTSMTFSSTPMVSLPSSTSMASIGEPF